MSNLPRLRTVQLVAGATVVLLAGAAHAQHGWPAEPGNSDHALGNTMGEYIGVQHAGIDLMEVPMYDGGGAVDASAPWVIVTVAGTPASLGDNSGMYNFTSVDPPGAADPAVYWYGHLQQGSYDVNYTNAFNNGTAVGAGDHIAKIVRWSACSFHHTHYELTDGGNYVNPLADITPNPDTASPEVDDLLFAQDNTDPWVQFTPASGSCTVVSGLADILVKARDRDEAGAALGGAGEVWVHNVRWRACPDGTPSCAWQTTRQWDTMPGTWYANNTTAGVAQFSIRNPWISNSSYCSAGWDYAIVTNYVGGMPNASGAWDTTTIADGSYSVSAELTDFAGRTTVINRLACVQNTASCTTELTVRDAADDTGAVPYPGGNWWLSPDITANPGTADQDVNINLGAPNPIEVRVWNKGSCSLPAGTTYNVCLGWGLPSGSVAHPLPAGQQIGCQSETVPAGGWAVGSSRTTTFTWTPDATLVPNGHHCLVAWVDSTADAVKNTPAVNHDDNRAQQNITFQAAPGPGAPGASHFWVNPQEMIKRRDLELRVRYSGPRATLSSIRLHVPAGLEIGRIVGGDVIGGYRGDKPVERCKLRPEELHRVLCVLPDKGDRNDLTRVIGGIDPSGRLLLEGIRVTGKPVRLTLEVQSEKGVRKGEFVEIDVIERGVLPGSDEVTPVGGLTIHLDHGR